MITHGITFVVLGFEVSEYQLVICVCMCVINWPQEFQWNPSTAAVGNHNNVIKCRMVNMYKIILCVSIIVA